MASELVPEPRLLPEPELDQEPSLEICSSSVPDSGFLLEDVHCFQGEEHILKTLQNDSHYVGKKLVTDVRVPANIHRDSYRDFWVNELKPSKYVLDVIEDGYKLPFQEHPPPSFEGNNLSARLDAEFINNEVKRLELLGCIERVAERPYIVLPLSSVFSKKKRLVVDASRALNPFLRHRRVRLQVGLGEFFV